jgi:superfamily II DNA/RNA helicase
MAIYDDFCQSSQAVLFATDIAARGLGNSLLDFVDQFSRPV